MQTVTSVNKTSENTTSENKTSEAISEKYRDTEAGIYLRLMTCEDTDRIVAWRNSDAVRKNFIHFDTIFCSRAGAHRVHARHKAYTSVPNAPKGDGGVAYING